MYKKYWLYIVLLICVILIFYVQDRNDNYIQDVQFHIEDILLVDKISLADRNGNVVNQGIAVYGNKGSTDQHAYVQQLRDGLDNYFATFIEVLDDMINIEKCFIKIRQMLFLLLMIIWHLQ